MAQGKEELQKKKKEIEQNIEYTNILLKETNKNKEASLSQLAALKKKISFRQRLIYTINKEIKLIDKQIAQNNDIIESLENDLVEIKKEYAKMLYYGYKNRNSYDQLVFVFSSKDFNQALKRLKYIQNYSEFRKRQVALIHKTKELINEKINSLEIKRGKKRTLLLNKEEERKTLSSEKSEKNSIYNRLLQKETDLKKDLKKKQKEAKRLQKAIEDIIAEEIRRAREEANRAKGFALTPEQARLSANFKNNKGKLPWPVKRGIITGRFGEHDHPVLEGIKINNNGIDVSTNKGAMARALFEGVVTGVIILPGAKVKAVIVRHGEYFTVYGNLTQVMVKKGDNIITKQDIGVIYTEEQKFKTEAHLELWKLTDKGTVKLDPETWITKRSKAD